MAQWWFQGSGYVFCWYTMIFVLVMVGVMMMGMRVMMMVVDDGGDDG